MPTRYLNGDLKQAGGHTNLEVEVRFQATVINLRINYQHVESSNAMRLDEITKSVQIEKKSGPRTKEKSNGKSLRCGHDLAKEMRWSGQSHKQDENQENVVKTKCRKHFKEEGLSLEYQLLVVGSTLANFLWSEDVIYMH